MFGIRLPRPRATPEAPRPYDAKTYFEFWHRCSIPQEFSDRLTVGHDCPAWRARYHYNAVENSILEHLADHPLPAEPSVLDVGSGAGHWIDFYRAVLGSRRTVGIEISAPCAVALRQRFAGAPGVEIAAGDVSAPGFELGERFDVVNAIGVMFHVVEDARWRQAVLNLARHLVPGGLLVVGGHFGWRTRDVQAHGRDDFTRWEERARGAKILIDKRIRSLRRWKACARGAGLEFEGLVRTRTARGIRTPQNNVLFLRSRGDGSG
jgi:SAM-dependent methyltransferase